MNENVYKNLIVMRSLLLAFMFISISDVLHAGVFVEGGGSKIVIVNYSDMKIKVTWADPNGVIGGDTGVIDSYASGGLTYADQSPMASILVAYYQADGVTLVDAIPFEFSPIKMAKAMYVYGTESTPITSLTPKDEDDYQYPSRYIAWWYENINMAVNTDVDIAIDDEEGVGKDVALLMMKLDGDHSFMAF